MRQVTLQEFEQDGGLRQEAGRILREGEGLVCFPCEGTYRFGVNLLSEEGVLQLLQTKRRSGHRPALVMVRDRQMVEQVATEVPQLADQLMRALWPGHLTLRLPLSKDLPRKVYRDLSRSQGKVGVRVPQSPVARQLVQLAGVPLLVSSANQFKKHGAESLAKIRQQFARSIALFIEAGDLPTSPPSTILDFADGGFQIVRQGSVDEQTIRAALQR